MTKNDDYQKYSLVEDGLAILRDDGIRGRIHEIREEFSRSVLSRMNDDVSLNRALIKTFVMLPAVREVFCDRDLLSKISSLSGLPNAYENSVDRKLYMKRLKRLFPKS